MTNDIIYDETAVQGITHIKPLYGPHVDMHIPTQGF